MSLNQVLPIPKVDGTQTAADGDVDKTLISAQGTRKRIFLQKGVIDVTVAATGGGGLVKLEDGAGGSVLLSIDADAVGHHPFDFGEPGLPLSANTLLNLTVDSAGTNQATAVCSVTGVVYGA